MLRKNHVSTAHNPSTYHLYLAEKLARSSSKQNLIGAVRTLGPALVVLTFASAAHAQGTMDFSGAQTLMGTFNWRNDYVAVEQWSRNIIRDRYVFLVALHEQHEHFARTWDA